MMELKQDISAEHVQFVSPTELSLVDDETLHGANTDQSLSEEELTRKVESALLKKIEDGDKSAYFQLGQLYFEQDDFVKAREYFERSKNFDMQSLYQIGVICYDGLDGKPDQTYGVECLLKVGQSDARHNQHLIYAARYNIGRAYFQGYGVTRQSDVEAEKWWLLAADDGNPRASVKAQSTLGLFYSCPDNFNLSKVYFWHSEACGNGNLESQGCLGVMYANGIGVSSPDSDSAYVCLREATDRGNVYAMGNLVAHYYQHKLYTKAADLAARVSQLRDSDQIAKETDCLPDYISKGIATGCFYYGRCLAEGHGIKKDLEAAQHYYGLSYQFDPDVCAKLQLITQQGGI